MHHGGCRILASLETGQGAAGGVRLVLAVCKPTVQEVAGQGTG